MTTPNFNPGGWIQPKLLRELWFHTGTICNLACPFCFEGSKPGDKRIEPVTFADAKPFVDDALNFHVEQFCFTGGEPFVVRDIFEILNYALERRPCLVLTNATKPLLNRLVDVVKLRQKPYPLSFRASLDYPDPEKHDASRGKGNFGKTLETLSQLYQYGFCVSLARLETRGEDRQSVNRSYQPFLASVGLPVDLQIVVFPELFSPGSLVDVPRITEACMNKYQNEVSLGNFMCSYSKMVLKKHGRMSIYPCTLVDDDDDFNLGNTLDESMKYRIMLKHHRCYSCFLCGICCSEA